MDLRLTEEELTFRADVRAFVRDNLPASIREKTVAGRRLAKEDYVRWTRILAAKGWAAPHWPRQWGGTGWSPIEVSIFLDETSGHLFAVLKRTADHRMDALAHLPVMRRWWDFMAELMETEADHAPVVTPLTPMFHLD